MGLLPSCSRTAAPTKDAVDFLASTLAGSQVRLMTLETRNPHGGRGGSIDSDQCAWLVRELAAHPHRGVVVATRHRSGELHNARTTLDASSRILAHEIVSILLAHPNVLGWIGGHRHRPGAIRHGESDTGLWEMTPSLLGFGCQAWLGLQARRGLHFPGTVRPVPLVVAASQGGRWTAPE